MKITTAILLVSIAFASCNAGTTQNNDSTGLPIKGTWKLISGTLIEKGDTNITYYTKDLSFIKIINDSHFAFLKHDLTKGKDSATASFGAGGGSYTLAGNQYTEHLEYCNDRQWEGNGFTFTVTIQNDTLIQSGTEKVANANVDRINIEKYIRLKK